LDRRVPAALKSLAFLTPSIHICVALEISAMLRPSSSDVKLKACFILLLLAGAEGARISEQAKIAQAVLGGENRSSSSSSARTQQSIWPWSRSSDRSSYENAWMASNKKCKFSTGSTLTGSGACKGPGCAWQRLPGDGLPPLSDSCRLTDDYMLQPEHRSNFIEMQAGLLESKAKKYSEKECGSASSARWKCNRRSMQMLRALKFLSKAQIGGSAGQTQEQKEMINAAMKELAKAHGGDGEMILMLRRKMSGGASPKNPVEFVMHAISLITGLVKGTPEEKELARESIRNMPDAPAQGQAVEFDLPAEFKDALAVGKSEAITTIKQTSSKLLKEKAAKPKLDMDSLQAKLQTMMAETRVGQEMEDSISELEEEVEAASKSELEENTTFPSDLQEASFLELQEKLNASDEVELSWGGMTTAERDMKDRLENQKVKNMLVAQGWSDADAVERSMQLYKYKKSHRTIRPVTALTFVLTTAIVVAAAVFASVEVIAYLVWWIVFSLVGCATVAGIRNLMAPAVNSTTVKKWRGRWTAGDILTCSAKVMWIFVYAPLKVLTTLLRLTAELLFLPFKLLWKLGKGVRWLTKPKPKEERPWPALSDGKRGELGDLVAVVATRDEVWSELTHKAGKIKGYDDEKKMFTVVMEGGVLLGKNRVLLNARNLIHIKEDEKNAYRYFLDQDENYAFES